MRRLAHIHSPKTKNDEPIWHVRLAIVAVIVLQLILDSNLSVNPKYGIAIFELLLLAVLIIIAKTPASLKLRRSLAVVLTASVTITNIASLCLVIFSLFDTGNINGKSLLISSLAIYLTNIIVFALWYWEMEFNRGPVPQDFLFPQENAPEHAGLHKQGWSPAFFDYLYVSTTNATAFSPTDTMPLTRRAKALMSVQSLVSLIIVVLVTARAVSVIG